MRSIPPQPGKLRSSGRPTRRAGLFLAALLGVAGLSGCQGFNMNTAQVRVIDASPDSGLIDSYQNSSALAYNLGFGTATSYISTSPGVSTLAADKAGTRQALIASTETLAAGKQYTEIVGASLANMQQALFVDQSTPAPAGQISVRIIDEVTHFGNVDVYMVPLSPSGRVAGVSPLAANLSFGANSGYINLPEGTYAIDVVPSGTARTSSTVTLLSGAQLNYASGAVRTVVLIDQETLGLQHAALTPGVQAIVATDADAL
jgi:Domain of unknown function (DUF4397)